VLSAGQWAKPYITKRILSLKVPHSTQLLQETMIRQSHDDDVSSQNSSYPPSSVLTPSQRPSEGSEVSLGSLSSISSVGSATSEKKAKKMPKDKGHQSDGDKKKAKIKEMSDHFIACLIDAGNVNNKNGFEYAKDSSVGQGESSAGDIKHEAINAEDRVGMSLPRQQDLQKNGRKLISL